MWRFYALLLFVAVADGKILDNDIISSRSKRMVDGGDFLANPLNLTWRCTPQVPPPCTFTMPVTISVSSLLPRGKGISNAMQRDMILKAAKKWEEVTNDLKFEWASPGVTGDIDVRFAFIDGKGGAIGRAGNPSPNTIEPTWVRLDDAENWVTHEHADLSEQEYPLLWALTHEFGHAIGLRHSPNSADIMFGELQATRALLNVGDIIAAQALYGEIMVAGQSPNVGPPAPSPQLGQELNHRGGIIVDSLPQTNSNGGISSRPDNTGQSIGINGLIIDEPSSTDQSGEKAGRKRLRKVNCTKRQQRMKRCRRREKTTPEKPSPTTQTRSQRRVRTPRPSPTSFGSRILSRKTSAKSAVRVINSDLKN